LSALCASHQAVVTALPSAILITGLLGSWHCLGMCGGLIVAACPTKKDLIAYHLARLIGYAGLGALAGSIGTWIETSSLLWLSQSLGFLIALTLIYSGILAIRGSHLKLPFPFFNNLSYFKSASTFRAPLIGFCSVFLPCGWLYSIVLSLTTLSNPLQNAILMSAFWLGTLPILTISPTLLRLLTKKFSKTIPLLMGILMIALGLASLFLKFF